MVDDRKLDVLRAIVEDYVRTSEPVGSRALVERHRLAVSPATIRNDMSTLEDEGFIVQPHTSAGRIPTDKGYRLFVDQLSRVRPLSPAQRRAIHVFLDGAVDLDDVMLRSVRLLAQLTRQVAVVQYPSLSESRVRHVELVGVGPHRVLIIVIADTGRVEQRSVGLPVELDEEHLGRFQTRLRALTAGERFVDVPDLISGLAAEFDALGSDAPGSDAPGSDALGSDAPGSDVPGFGVGRAITCVLRAMLEIVVERHEERVVAGGAANLARTRDFTAQLEPVLEALEEQLVLLRLLGEQANGPEHITVTIGHEHDLEGLTSTSVVSAGYGTMGASVGRLGVVGPTRMDYPANMGVVRAVSRYLGRLLNS